VKLVFYSGGDEKENRDLDFESLKLVDSPSPTLTFIPSSSYDGETEFREFVEQYQAFGVSRFLYFPVDVPQDRVLLSEVFSSDLIHLGGGNTYYFLKYLRLRGLLPFLTEFALGGGVLSGLSAGAILMTPNINTAGYPKFDRDENEEEVKNFKAMNLVRFEFFPHYKNSARYDRELIRESRKTPLPLFALPDGSGIIKEGDKMTFLGRAWCFHNGVKTLLNS
jgi:dipeptidase E